jgi:hypothetical protein
LQELLDRRGIGELTQWSQTGCKRRKAEAGTAELRKKLRRVMLESGGVPVAWVADAFITVQCATLGGL